ARDRGSGTGAVRCGGRPRAARAGGLTNVAAQSLPAWCARARSVQLSSGTVRQPAARRLRREVLKVEPPQGDGMMQLGPSGPDETPLLHAARNAGKTICRI